MAPEIGSKIKDREASAWLGALSDLLHPGELVTVLSKTKLIRPVMDGVAVTTVRVVGFSGIELMRRRKVRIDVSATDISQVEVRSNRLSADSLVIMTRIGKEVSLGTIPAADIELVRSSARQLAAAGVPAEIDEAIAAQAAAVSLATSAWGDVEVFGNNPSDKAWKTLRRHATPGETPRFVISNGAAGVFAVFEDRCMIIKVGAMTGFMTGSLGGGRITTFPFSEITGIEYNSGLVTGVLEVLTPSYQGTANKDYWRGTGKSRNADSNDPWTLSNTLPLSKPLYQQALPRLNEMRVWVADAKRPAAPVTGSVASTLSSGGLEGELRKLASLRDRGVLDEAEFLATRQAAIARYIGG